MLPELQGDRDRVAALHIQIVNLKQALARSRTEKALAQERLDSYKYPVLTLPTEIVTEIFTHFLPAYPGFPPLAGRFSPTLLTQICRRWREIALGTPALWRAIGSINSTIYFPQLNAQTFNLWLQRSRSCPLAMSLSGLEKELIAAVLPHRARFEYLEIRELLPLSNIRSIIQGPLPLLRHLELTSMVGRHIFAFGKMPLLRSVVLDGPGATLRVMLPWTQLTSVTLLTVLDMRYCAAMLQQTPNLIHCELHVHHYGRTSDHLDIPLPCLKSFFVFDLSGRSMMNFSLLGRLVTPALRSLEITEGFLAPGPVDSLRRFISKSGCKLEVVRIVGPRVVTETSYRREFPTIREFLFTSQYSEGSEWSSSTEETYASSTEEADSDASDDESGFGSD